MRRGRIYNEYDTNDRLLFLFYCMTLLIRSFLLHPREVPLNRFHVVHFSSISNYSRPIPFRHLSRPAHEVWPIACNPRTANTSTYITLAKKV